MRRFGLIGKTLKHSFSQRYFSDKFTSENIRNSRYDLFELPAIDDFPALIENTSELIGLNVTMPYKNEVMQYLTTLDRSAKKVGAVNVIKINSKERIGYNSDYYGFKLSLEGWVGDNVKDALVLGTGGSSKAVTAALSDLGITYQYVSRTPKTDCLTYRDLYEQKEWISEVQLIVNTTPLGMYPDMDNMADIPMGLIAEHHFVYDLVYNPLETKLMREAKTRGAQVKNGLEMLELQAEKSWEIWNS